MLELGDRAGRRRLVDELLLELLELALGEVVDVEVLVDAAELGRHRGASSAAELGAAPADPLLGDPLLEAPPPASTSDW